VIRVELRYSRRCGRAGPGHRADPVCSRYGQHPLSRLPGGLAGSPSFPDRRQIREPETAVKAVFACTLARHLEGTPCPAVTDGLDARWRRPIIAKRREMGRAPLQLPRSCRRRPGGDCRTGCGCCRWRRGAWGTLAAVRAGRQGDSPRGDRSPMGRGPGPASPRGARQRRRVRRLGVWLLRAGDRPGKIGRSTHPVCVANGRADLAGISRLDTARAARAFRGRAAALALCPGAPGRAGAYPRRGCLADRGVQGPLPRCGAGHGAGRAAMG